MAYVVPQKYLSFCSTNSCVIQEISGLSYYSKDTGKDVFYSRGTSEDAMADFCQQNFESKLVKYKTASARPNEIYSHYMFSAGVDRGAEKTYGSNFAAFIRENKLGNVVGTEVIENKAYHPGRDGQAWLWSPDHEALLKWWDSWKQGHAIPEPEPVVVKEPIVTANLALEQPNLLNVANVLGGIANVLNGQVKNTYLAAEARYVGSKKKTVVRERERCTPEHPCAMCRDDEADDDDIPF